MRRENKGLLKRGLVVLAISLALAGGYYALANITSNISHEKAEAKGAVGHPQEKDLWTLAKTVYGEARGEPYEGQVAVAAIVLNRVKHESFPGTVNGVVFQPQAFTAVADGQYYMEPDESSKKAARDALAGWDPTGGCIYYWNPATATSKWVWSRPVVKRIGKHVFAK